MLKQLGKDNMLEMLTLGNLFKAKAIFEAALEMTKANLTWINSQEDAQEKLRNLSQDIKSNLRKTYPREQCTEGSTSPLLPTPLKLTRKCEIWRRVQPQDIG